MEPVLIIDQIQLPKSRVHTLKKPNQLFPFTTHSAKYIQGNFHIVVSELARIITGFQIDQSKLEDLPFEYVKDANKISEFIAENKAIEFQGDEIAKVDFIRFIDGFLFNEQSLNIVHPYLYNFIGESESKEPVLRNIGAFVHDLLIGEDKDLIALFSSMETDNLLIELIISSLNEIKATKKNAGSGNYSDILPHYTKLIKDDLRFMMKHREFFLNNFELFVNYYVFMYILQSLIQLEKFSNVDPDKLAPLYFALDWEAVTKKRLVASQHAGYKFIKDHASNLFAHEHVLRQLSHNILNIGTDYRDVRSYATLVQHLESMGQEYVTQFTKDLQEWIVEYSKWAGEEPPTLADSVDELLRQLFKQVKKGMNDGAQQKYGLGIEYLGSGTFLKPRGSLGNLLNMSHDFLMLMTAVIVKDDRMPLKTLIAEFEKRGIAFDRYSVEAIVELFNNHNILDTKSDSGDAQYVKPIL